MQWLKWLYQAISSKTPGTVPTLSMQLKKDTSKI